jgi:hypothetical protein
MLSFKIVLHTHKNLIYSLLFVANLHHLIYSILSSVLSHQMARTYQTACKSTVGRYHYGKLAPRHQPEVVEQPEGQQPPEEAEPSCPSRSPPRKRLHYDAPEVTTRLG